MKISIIIRFRNEETYLPWVLKAVRAQRMPADNYEIIGIDNYSTDSSRNVAVQYADKMIQLSDYHPGKALNRAIALSRGDYICVLSAHTIPADDRWLDNLYRHLVQEDVAAVYGAQLYPLHSKFLDKRDLDIFSTTQPRIETQNSDFWNANSILKRSVWEAVKFDETVYELEDHYWTKIVLPLGYKVIFEPAALVYHYTHIERLDRVHLSEADQNECETDLIEQSINQLTQSDVDWPTAMKAGLTLSSLTHNKGIHLAIDAIGNTLLNYWDFDVRWRMAQALGKIPHDKSVQFLIQGVRDSSYYVRDEVAWSLAKLGELASEKTYQSLTLTEYSAEEKLFFALALGMAKVSQAEAQAVKYFSELVNHENIEIVKNAYYFWGEMNLVDGAEELLYQAQARLRDRAYITIHNVIIWAIGSFAVTHPDLIDVELLKNYSFNHDCLLARFEATVALGKFGMSTNAESILEHLVRVIHTEDARNRYGAIQCLRLWAQTHTLPKISWDIDLEEVPDFGVRYEYFLLNKQQKNGSGSILL